MAGISPASIAAVDRGGTVTLGGTAQNAMAINAGRVAVILQNDPSATEVLYWSLSGAATTNSPSLAVGQYVVLDSPTCGTTALSVLGATTGHRWRATEFGA